MSKTCIVYYSHSGNTRQFAQLIAKQIQGDCFEILPEKAYPESYNAVVKQAKKEIRAGFLPALQSTVPDITAYDAVLIGTPNWWSTIAPPIATFLKSNAFTGKKVVPFCTHGGGGFGHIERDIEKYCPSSDVLSGLAVYAGSCKETEIRNWLCSIGVL